MKEVLILVAIQLFATLIFFFSLRVLKKYNISKNIGWFIIALMVLVLNRIGEYFGYDSVTIGAADFLFLLILIPGYLIVNSYNESKKKNILEDVNIDKDSDETA